MIDERGICDICNNTGLAEYVTATDAPLGVLTPLNDLPKKIGPCPDCEKGREMANRWTDDHNKTS